MKSIRPGTATGAIESEMSVNRQFRYSITPMMPTRVSTLVTMPEQRRRHEALNAFDVAWSRGPIEIPGLLLVMFGEREPMNVVVERPPQVVHHPLPDVGGEGGVRRRS
mgnify:CR=1 FL=1